MSDDGLAGQVVTYLRDLIVKDSLRPGDKLPGEGEISRTLGISRPVVREATRTLAAIGLVEIAAGRAPRVGSMQGGVMQHVFENALITGQAEALQILEVRRGLEIAMAAAAAKSRDAAVAETLAALGQAMGRALHDLDAYVTLDIAFHRALAEATGNPFYVMLADACRSALEASMAAGMRHRFGQEELNRVQALHLEIIAAIAEGDEAAAADAMARHFDDALAALYRPYSRT
jgi:DNA-binding FadR family transcriptional regulator